MTVPTPLTPGDTWTPTRPGSRAKARTIEERFLSFVPERPKNGCWLWCGAKNLRGYGKIGVNDGCSLAHRVSYELFCQQIPVGLFVRHTCDTRACVNPGHLVTGTHEQNMRDMTERGRSAIRERNAMSKLTAEQVTAIKASTEPGSILAARYGISKGRANDLRNGRGAAGTTRIRRHAAVRSRAGEGT
jgi:hypothetical protein